jgi:hypothetical protein
VNTTPRNHDRNEKSSQVGIECSDVCNFGTWISRFLISSSFQHVRLYEHFLCNAKSPGLFTNIGTDSSDVSFPGTRNSLKFQ